MQSKEQHRIVINHHVDAELDQRKRLYEGLSDMLSEVARDIAQTVPLNLPHEMNVIYFPQIGFLITIPMDIDTGRSLWEGSDTDVWEKMFSSDAIVYYKNQQMRQLDERFGDIYGEICGWQHVSSIKLLVY